ncbi:hypothetical protein ACFQBQ_18610 [Granulicella cerasi]|uniref:Uncharacterized protein n=1 Tax=Granulicella cerasi TaxID=741063 RepID=A0ABW1ZEM2_9BACT
MIHADPPVEHKAYLHRSTTARAGAQGTVITLMTDDQVRDVRDLTRQAGIKPTTTRVTPNHPLLAELAPGERTYAAPSSVSPAAAPEGSSRPAGGGNRSGARGSGRNTADAGRSGGRSRLAVRDVPDRAPAPDRATAPVALAVAGRRVALRRCALDDGVQHLQWRPQLRRCGLLGLPAEPGR